MNTLITGGLGFIGSALAKKVVKRGDKVTILSKSTSKLENIAEIKEDVDLIIKDIVDIDLEVQGQDQIFHLASTADNYNMNRDPYLDLRVNGQGTIALLEAIKKHSPKSRLVYTSTINVNGNLTSFPATPESPTHPLGLYPATRLLGENICSVYNSLFGLNFSTARFTNVFGEGEQRNNKEKAAFNNMIWKAIQGEEIPLYNGGNFIRDYIHVLDVVDACLTIAERGKEGEIYYVGKGGKTKFGDLVNMVIEEVGAGSVRSVDPPEFHRHVGIGDYYCDNTPLRNLGWKPRISLREGIRRTIEAYKNNGFTEENI